MKLQAYIRGKLSRKLIPLIRKDNCECCGKIETLEVHHVKLFSDILNETLHEIALEYKDTKNYSKSELKLITNVILGKHLDIEYMTLCKNCHEDLHIIDRHNLYYIRKDIMQDSNNTQLIICIEKFLNIKLFKNEQIELKKYIIDGLKIKSNHGSIGYNSLNNAFEKFGLNYKIISKKENSTKSKNFNHKYWEIIESNNIA